MSEISVVPQNNIIARLHEMERAAITEMVSLYNGGKLDPVSALVKIGVLATMRQHRASLERSFLKGVVPTEEVTTTEGETQ